MTLAAGLAVAQAEAVIHGAAVTKSHALKTVMKQAIFIFIRILRIAAII
jgi:hypothetical protein